MFWNDHAAKVRETCDGEFWTINEHSAKVDGLNLLQSEPGGGIAKHPNTVRQGGNSGYQAIGIALLFGAARIVLLGFDMQFTNGRKHWHKDHAKNNPTGIALKNWRANFRELASVCPVPIINATRETALDCFPRMSLEEALA